MRKVVPYAKFNRGPIGNDTFKLVNNAINSTDIVDQLNGWWEQRRMGAGGRPTNVSFHALLVGMALTILDHRAPTLNEVTNTLFYRLTEKQRRTLRLRNVKLQSDGLPDRDDHHRVYQSVCGAHHRLYLLLDPDPIRKGNRIPTHLWELRQRYANLDQRATNAQRLLHIVNEIVQAAINTQPRTARRAFNKYWKGGVAVDGTTLPSHSRPYANDDPKGRIDPSAGWHVRDGEDSYIGYELTIARAIPNDPDDIRRFPLLPVGFTISAPGHAPGINGALVLNSIRERQHPDNGYLLVDQSYRPKSADFHDLIRPFNYTSVFNYGKDTSGLQGTHKGMLLIDGWWYCPSTPQRCITVVADRAEGRITYEQYAAILEERKAYTMRYARRNTNGKDSTDLVCPAAGPSPTMLCKNKPPTGTVAVTLSKRKKRLPQVPNPPANKPAVCSNKSSVSVPNTTLDRYRQPLHYASPEWTKAFGMRSMIEGLNGNIKDPIRTAIGTKGRIRCVGQFATAFASAWTLFELVHRYAQRFCHDVTTDNDGIHQLPTPAKRPLKIPYDPATLEIKNAERRERDLTQQLERLQPGHSPPTAA